MVKVTVYDVNEAPVFTGAPALSVAVDEHDVNDQYVVMDLADYDARDEEGGVTWSLTGRDRGDFAISADGVVTFRAAPNFEAPADFGRNNVYKVTVVARDTASGSTRRSVSANVTVTVADVEEAGKIEVVNSNLDPVVGETVSFMLSDPDGGISSIEWKVQLRDPNPNSSHGGWAFEPSDGTNTTTFRYLVDEDHAGKEMRAYVAYSDRRGSGKTARSQGTVAITANTEAPEITTVLKPYTAFTVRENTETSRIIKTYRATGVGEGSVLTWSLEGADRADFTITRNAQGHGDSQVRKRAQLRDAGRRRRRQRLRRDGESHR